MSEPKVINDDFLKGTGDGIDKVLNMLTPGTTFVLVVIPPAQDGVIKVGFASNLGSRENAVNMLKQLMAQTRAEEKTH